jgi:hypothetical protein
MTISFILLLTGYPFELAIDSFRLRISRLKIDKAKRSTKIIINENEREKIAEQKNKKKYILKLKYS